MSTLTAIQTANAPAAIGPYSQAIKAGDFLFCSGQVPLVPATMEMVTGDISAQAQQVFENLKAVAEAAGTSLASAVKINISLNDMNDFAAVNEVMKQYFNEPYPARACVEVARLPKDAGVEIEAILYLK